MNFKRFHESKNLLEDVITGANIAANGSIAFTPDYNIWVAKVTAGETYRANNVNGTYGFYIEKPTGSSITYNNSRELFSGDSPTIVVPQGISYIGIRATVAATNVMLNLGSEPLPYEPYGDTWHDIPHYIMGTSTDTITTPAVLYPNDVTATVGLKGQMEQTGTPTPTTPIQPSECGERTGNLLNPSIIENGYNINNNGEIVVDSRRIATTQPIDVSSENTVTLTYTYEGGTINCIYALFSGSTMIERYAYGVSGMNIDVSNGDKLYLCWYRGTETITKTTVTKIMLNTGSEALPYEPWGIKIPILNNSTTTPVYLGEVPTTRRIKKWVLTGKERDWNKGNYPPSGGYQFFIPKPSDIADNPDWLTTHFKKGSGLNGSAFASYLSLYPEASILPENATINDFKAWLAAQYAAGTPVCVWYVLANPETAVVNEPIRKIGDYADEVSNVTIPTTAGANTIDVDTTLKPSEVTANYKGWHPVADVHERENGAWT